MKVTCRDVANVYLDLYKDRGVPVSESKLQILIRYARHESTERFGLEISSDEPSGEYDVHIFTAEQLEMFMDVDTYCSECSNDELEHPEHTPVLTYFRDAVAGLPTEGRIDERGRLFLPEDWE